MATRSGSRVLIGWREWVLLPELCPLPIKAKVDTGARTSALHALALEVHSRPEGTFASFELHPLQRSAEGAVQVEWPVLGYRRVRSSNGRVETRPVIRTLARAGSTSWPIEVTLAAREEMGFRMLLGRSALRRRFVIDPGRSFLTTTPGKARRPG